ncbi:MAG: hypothetical protein HC888_02840 [Candidatus Competibacteraceae bacterium]|nr:hypothetical protein [Candidatus Competibacteraceae bacterium]
MGNAQMIRFAALMLVALPVCAGPFEDLVRAHNTGAPLASVMTESEAARWEGMFKDGRGAARITNAKWSAERPHGLARWEHTIGTKRQSGWLAIQTNESGRINAFYYTEKPIPRSRGNNAVAGQSADSATTVVGMASGFAEGNPLIAGMSGLAIAAVKIGSTLALQEYAGLNYCTAASTSLAAPDGERPRGISRCWRIQPRR